MASEREEALQRRLLVIFKGEAAERIGAIAAQLPNLQSSTGETRDQLIEAMFRDSHSLKAAARSVGQKEIELLCQAAESVFAALKRGDCTFSAPLPAALQSVVDAMEDYLAAIEDAPNPERQSRAIALARALERALEETKSTVPTESNRPGPVTESRQVEPWSPADALPRPVATPPPAPPLPRPIHSAVASTQASTVETVRLSVQRLEILLRECEEMLSEKLAARQVSTLLNDAIGSFAEWHREWGKMRAVKRPPQMERTPADGSSKQTASLRQFLDWNERHMAGLETKLTAVAKAAESEAHRLGLKVDRLLLDVKDILTLPCSTLFQGLPRIVRDLARDQAKDAELTIEGGDLEIDRRILQELREPLLHLVRNCLDHGIEEPHLREAAGKRPQAMISIRVASKDGDKVEFTIADDGRGIAADKIAASAVKLGLLSPEMATLDETQLLQLIFESGLSTSPMITDLSGRGLGLAIVRERVERLGGRISVDSEVGSNTIFCLVVPLSLATYHGISVRVCERVFVFPTLSVSQVVGVRRSDISTVEGRLVIDVGGGLVPLVRLMDVLELPVVQASTPGERIEAVIVGTAGRQVAFEVDSVLGDQEILLKPLGKSLVRVRNVQGGTILASGEIAPILHVGDLVKSAAKLRPTVATERRSDEPTAVPGNILVVEDSITARGLLRGILEAAGYRVKTAVDGMEAWATLNLESFDLVVSDVEMPRMNGLDLTERIRSHRRLADLPVILVTALESREDRERGVEVGANAYILKGGFEQGSLLAAVKRLI